MDSVVIFPKSVLVLIDRGYFYSLKSEHNSSRRNNE